MFKITKAILHDLSRNWALWLYAAFLMTASFGLFYIESHYEKSVIGILSMTLLLVPAFSLIYSVIYYFNSIDFITILLVQPINRSSIIISFITGLSITFASITLLGTGIPLLIYAPTTASVSVLTTGIFLAVIFVGIGSLIAVYTREKSHGLGIALLLLFYFSLLFDGLVLLLIYTFSDYPVEKLALYITFLNPIDLGRIMTLMQTDAAALMGYTGAVFQQFFGELTGMFVSIGILCLWIIIPAFLSIKKFSRKKF